MKQVEYSDIDERGQVFVFTPSLLAEQKLDNLFRNGCEMVGLHGKRKGRNGSAKVPGSLKRFSNIKALNVFNSKT